MAFPAGLSVLGGALTGVAEGLQAVPTYIDRDEELAARHEERLAKEQLRPITLEEARLRMEKMRREALEPRPIPAGTHGSYIWNPTAGKYEFDAQAAALGGASETAYIRKLRSLSTMADDPSNPLLQKAAIGELERTSGAKDTAQLQAMRRYFTALDHGEEPLPEDKQLMQIIVNRSIRGSSEGGYYPLNAPLPGVTGQTPPASPPPPVTGGTTAPSGPTGQPTAAAPQAQSSAPSAASRSYQRWFQGAGESYAKQTMDGMLRDDPGAVQLHTKAALRGFLSAYPQQGEVVAAPPAGAGSQPPTAAAVAPVAPPAAEPAAVPGPTMLTQPTAKRAFETQVTEGKAERLPTFTTDQVATSQELYPWLSGNPDLRTLNNEQMNLVNKTIEARKEDTAFNRVLRQAAPQIAELASMESSQTMAKRAEELLVPEVVGMRGKSNRLIQQFVQQLPFDEQTKAQHFDPRIADLEVVAHAIGYIHANAVKRIGAAGGSGQRGVTQYDVEEVTRWFDPFAVTASVPEMKEKLKELQRLIQQARPIVEHEMQALGIDPKTLTPLKGRKFGGAGPSVPPATDPNKAFDEATRP